MEKTLINNSNMKDYQDQDLKSMKFYLDSSEDALLDTSPIPLKQENIVDNHLWLLNTILGQTLKEIAIYLKNRDIRFGYLPDFLNNPPAYPGNKTTGLRQISEKFLQDVVSKYYFKIQAEKLPVKFVFHTIIKRIFREGEI